MRVPKVYKSLDFQRFSFFDGIRFYNRYKRRVRDILGTSELEFVYDTASSVAMHSRFAGAVLGLRVRSEVSDGRVHQEIKALVQELALDRLDAFLVTVLYVLRVQERILTKLGVFNPEIDDPLLLETRIPAFRRNVDSLFQLMGERRPDLASKC